MNIERTLREIDKDTGDINACLELLKRHKYSHRDLYYIYRQYWILVYVVGMELDTIEDCKSLPETARLKKVCAYYPKGLKYFPDHTLKKLLKLSDQELLQIFPDIWLRLPKNLLIERILKADKPELFLNSNIRIDWLPELSQFSSGTLRTLMGMVSPDLLPEIVYVYYKKYSEEFLINYVDSKKAEGFEKSVNLENFRIVKVLMQSLNLPISSCFLHLAQSILSTYMAPPVISSKLLPFELEEILLDLSPEDLESLKSFVFRKMIAFNIRSQMATLLKSCGLECSLEIKLQRLKEGVILQMPEEFALELLASQNIEETEELVGNWKRQKVFNNFLAP